MWYEYHDSRRWVIVGAGGHGGVIIEAICADYRQRLRSAPKIIGFLDNDTDLHRKRRHNLPILGAPTAHTALRILEENKPFKMFAAIAIGDNKTRTDLARFMQNCGYTLPNIIHPNAFVADSARANSAGGIVVCADACICAEAFLSDLALINTKAIVEHNCDIGYGSHIAPGAKLAGHVQIRSHAFVGMGAMIRQRTVIGRESTVGMGSVVISDVEPNTTVVGSPAKELAREER